MNASLFYYKGFNLRDSKNYFQICVDGFSGIEQKSHIEDSSDFHTHAHDLPPQMGGCYESKTEEQHLARKKVDEGPWFDLHDTLFDESELDDDAKNIALERMLLFKSNVINANPMKSEFDAPLRQALTLMMTGDKCESTAHTLDNDQIAQSLRYLRDRINVPRDMPIYSGRYMREALEEVASMYSSNRASRDSYRSQTRSKPVKFHGKNKTVLSMIMELHVLL